MRADSEEAKQSGCITLEKKSEAGLQKLRGVVKMKSKDENIRAPGGSFL